VAGLTLMVALVVIDIIGRTFIGSGLPGTVEANEYLLIIVGFVGMVQTYHERAHVSVDILFDKFPNKTKRIIEKTNNSIIMLFSLIFMYAGAARFWSAFKAGDTSWFGAYIFPVWFVRAIVPITFFFLALQCAMRIFYKDK